MYRRVLVPEGLPKRPAGISLSSTTRYIRPGAKDFHFIWAGQVTTGGTSPLVLYLLAKSVLTEMRLHREILLLTRFGRICGVLR